MTDPDKHHDLSESIRKYLEDNGLRSLRAERTPDGGFFYIESPRSLHRPDDNSLIDELKEMFTKIYVEKSPIELREYSDRAQALQFLVDRLLVLDKQIFQSGRYLKISDSPPRI